MKEEEIDKIFTYHRPTQDSQDALNQVREGAKILARIININLEDCPDKSAAIRLLRECVMTTNAGIILNQEEESSEQQFENLTGHKP